MYRYYMVGKEGSEDELQKNDINLCSMDAYSSNCT